MGSFACRISRTDCTYWNAVEFNLNSTWIQFELMKKWSVRLSGIDFAGTRSPLKLYGTLVRISATVLRNPSAHFALCALLQRCCIHQEFVIYLSKFVKHVFLLYFVCWSTLVLMHSLSAAVFIGGSGYTHTALSVWSCMAAFACRISRTNCSYWNAVDFILKSIWINEEVEWQSVIKFGNNHRNFVY